MNRVEAVRERVSSAVPVYLSSELGRAEDDIRYVLSLLDKRTAALRDVAEMDGSDFMCICAAGIEGLCVHRIARNALGEEE